MKQKDEVNQTLKTKMEQIEQAKESEITKYQNDIVSLQKFIADMDNDIQKYKKSYLKSKEYTKELE